MTAVTITVSLILVDFGSHERILTSAGCIRSSSPYAFATQIIRADIAHVSSMLYLSRLHIKGSCKLNGQKILNPRIHVTNDSCQMGDWVTHAT